MIFGGCEFTVKPVRTNVRGILITHTSSIERFVRNGKREFARFRLRLSNGKSIFAR